MVHDKFYSHFGEDRLIRQLIPDLPDRGFYVDVGAGAWDHLSNTLHFEQSGWNGLCIEANPRRAIALSQMRKAAIEHCAISPSYSEFHRYDSARNEILVEHITYFQLGLNEDLSTCRMHLTPDQASSCIAVPNRKLEDVLQRHGVGEIDLISIDVEGDEGHVWQSLGSRRPRIVIIEYSGFGLSKQEASAMIGATGDYRYVADTEANLIYQLK